MTVLGTRIVTEFHKGGGGSSPSLGAAVEVVVSSVEVCCELLEDDGFKIVCSVVQVCCCRVLC